MQMQKSQQNRAINKSVLKLQKIFTNQYVCITSNFSKREEESYILIDKGIHGKGTLFEKFLSNTFYNS